MRKSGSYNTDASRGKPDAAMAIGLGGVILFFLASGFISYWNVHILNRDSQAVVQTHRVITALGDLLSIMKDAETGQRGFLITGEEKYLEPYDGALTDLDERLNELQNLIEPGTRAQTRLPNMKLHIHNKMVELAKAIELRRNKGFDAARAVVVSDIGKDEMDALRKEIGVTQSEEEQLRDQRLAEIANAYWVAVLSGVLTCALGLVLSIAVALLIRRSTAARVRESWLQTGQVGLATAMFGEQRIEQLSENVLRFLAEYFNAQAGVFYVQQADQFLRLAGYGLKPDGVYPDRITTGDGLLGQAVKDQRSFVVHDVPHGYLSVSSGLGSGNPNHLIVCPAQVDRTVNAVFELGFFRPTDDRVLELLERVANPIGIAIRSAKDRGTLQNLLEETQSQAEELQSQSEELRVSNEELEEQSRALRESQTRLEQQQAELEQTNSQLEEQAQILESQRDDLSLVKNDLEAQALDLERASRYKSDFLANMSHELRTPLNSSLILAKLLADNREGNLTEEQVKYATTIQSAGRDLLALIGDILDLSKIESGHMDVNVETLRIDDLLGTLSRTFQPIAADRSLTFETQVAPDAPKSIQTDAQRLEQILNNLLSNAMKFTENGGVTLEVRGGVDNKVFFAVIDTGIGISDDQSEMVFEAFRQADGTTNRRYGGTGLGLSISRQLTHLLGGDITLTSAPGKGSTFTVSVPLIMASMAATRVASGGTPASSISPRGPAAMRVTPKPDLPDDRAALSGAARLMLIIEDDESFARILYDLAHEQGFQCLIATSAETGLALAVQFLPSAVLLDIGLPDNTGLSVLDRLKHDNRTRHIPVHVVSGNDYSQTAMSLGAAGYMLKPVKRDELIQAFENLEAKLTQKLRRVLVVEDDAVQLESMRLLLGSRDVETLGVGSAAECLELLRVSTFDCMVLDLSLPDASGFSLLETLSQEDAYSFPPVIVYTGRELSADEEQRLRRYSKSIIVKGVKSPERLLDEVTLFLHQVVADLPEDKQRLIQKAKSRDAALEGHLILIVEDDIRNIFALTSVLEPVGAKVEIARNGKEALAVLERTLSDDQASVDLVLMDIMMPEMDGVTAIREIRKRPEWKRLPIIALTAKAMKDDQEHCLEAGANDYIAKPLDVEKLLSLIRVWIPR